MLTPLILIALWLKTRDRQGTNFNFPTKKVPFLEFQPLLDRCLLDIRQEFDLLQFIK